METKEINLEVKYLDLNLTNIQNLLNSNGLSDGEKLSYCKVVDILSFLINAEVRLSKLCISKEDSDIAERNNLFHVVRTKKLDLFKIISNL